MRSFFTYSQKASSNFLSRGCYKPHWWTVSKGGLTSVLHLLSWLSDTIWYLIPHFLWFPGSLSLPDIYISSMQKQEVSVFLKRLCTLQMWYSYKCKGSVNAHTCLCIEQTCGGIVHLFQKKKNKKRKKKSHVLERGRNSGKFGCLTMSARHFLLWQMCGFCLLKKFLKGVWLWQVCAICLWEREENEWSCKEYAFSTIDGISSQ